MSYINGREIVSAIVDEYQKNQQENIGILKQPKSMGQIGMVGVIVWAIILLIGENDPPANIGEGVLVGIYWLFFALFICLILYERNFQVIYKDGKITYRNMFRKTRVYDCKDIVHIYYMNNGGIQFTFKNGKNLFFDETEIFFCNVIMETENLRGEFKGGLPTVIKIYLHPICMIMLWSLEVPMLILAYAISAIVWLAIFWALVCLVIKINSTTYDREKQMLICRKWGFAKHYDIRHCQVKPIYEYGYIRKIKIYDGKKYITTFSISPVDKNRGWMIRTLCQKDARKFIIGEPQDTN